jgi:hypothetical protein
MNFDEIKLKVQAVFTKEKMSALGSKIVFIGEKIKEKYNELSVKVKKYMKKD